MKKNIPVFTVCCVICLFVFAAFMAWYNVSSASLRAKTAETTQLLETSRGREERQWSEYNQAQEALPLTQKELDEKKPLADEAEARVAALKEKRNELRKEKQALEEAAAKGTAEEQPDPASEAGKEAGSHE